MGAILGCMDVMLGCMGLYGPYSKGVMLGCAVTAEYTKSDIEVTTHTLRKCCLLMEKTLFHLSHMT